MSDYQEIVRAALRSACVCSATNDTDGHAPDCPVSIIFAAMAGAAAHARRQAYEECRLIAIQEERRYSNVDLEWERRHAHHAKTTAMEAARNILHAIEARQKEQRQG